MYEGREEKLTGSEEIKELAGVLTRSSSWMLRRGADGGEEGEGSVQLTSVRGLSRTAGSGAGGRCLRLRPPKKLMEEARDTAGR